MTATWRSRLPLLALALLAFVIVAIQTRYTITLIHLLVSGTEVPQIPASVDPDTFAAHNTQPEWRAAGGREGDRVLAVDGQPVSSRIGFARAVLRHRAGDQVVLRLERDGAAPFEARVRLAPGRVGAPSPKAITETVFIGIVLPWSCLLLGLFVALRRPRDPAALALFVLLWWLSQSFLANAEYRQGWEPWFTVPDLFFNPLVNQLWPAAWLWFGLAFPNPASPYRLLPWARWLLGIPLALSGILYGITYAGILHAPQTFLPFAIWDDGIPGWVFRALTITPLVLGTVNLIYKLIREPQPAARRKLRLLLAGVSIGMAPMLALAVAAVVTGRDLNSFDQRLLVFAGLAVMVVPATMAYVVVVEKALDVGIVIRRGLQYAFASHTVAVIQVALIATLVWLAVNIEALTMQTGLRKAGAIAACLAAILAVRRSAEWMRSRIDRRFFREAVDAERVLHDLTEQVHRIVDPQALLRTVSERIATTLHVPRVAALLADNGEFRPAFAHGYGTPAPDVRLPERSATIETLRSTRAPLTVRADGDGHAAWGELHSELLLPLAAQDRLLGILSLGAKQSEEPYSRADLRLLQSVAAQTGLALDNSRLAAAVAAEAVVRERLHRELEIAREVQQRLFPKAPPAVPGLDLAGICRPAQSVGGDYYDFLLTPTGEVGLAIGDVSGKGVPAALLMASLQASLRAMTLVGATDLGSLMANLNRLTCEATQAGRFATFFYGLYEPASACLRYASAGHNPALLVRADGETTWLTTGGVGLGLTKRATYRQAEVRLLPGDCLILYTDGVTEAMNEQQEEFGEARLVRAATDGDGSAARQQSRILDAVAAFSGATPQHDDVTLIVACRV